MGDTMTKSKRNEQILLDAAVQADSVVPELHLKTWLVFIAAQVLGCALLINIIGLGAWARNATAEVGGSDRSTWLTTATFALTALLGPPASQISDLFGRRWVLLVVTACGLVGTIVVAVAQSFAVLVVGTCIAGFAFAAQGLTYAVSSEVLPRKWRAWANASITISNGAAAIAMILAGAQLTSDSRSGWRTYFYINAGLYGVTFVVLFLCYSPPPRPVQLRYSRTERFKSADWVGHVLLAAATLPLIVGVSYGDNPYSWGSAIVLGPMIVGIVMFFAYAAWEWKGTSTGTLAHVLFGNRNLPIAMLGAFLEGAAFSGVNSYYLFQISVQYGLGAIQGAGRFTLYFVGAIIWCFVWAGLSTKTKRLRPSLLLGLAISIGGQVAFVYMTPDAKGERLSWLILLVASGLASATIAQISAAQMAAPAELIGATSAIMLSVRSLGGAIAGAIFTSVFSQTLSEQISARIPAAVLQAGLAPQYIGEFIGDLAAQNTAALAQIPGVNGEIIGAGVAALLESYYRAFRKVWIITTILWAICFVVSIFLIDPVNKFTGLVDNPAEENLHYHVAGEKAEIDQKAAVQMLEMADFEPVGTAQGGADSQSQNATAKSHSETESQHESV